MENAKIAVVGATGVVGREVLAALEERHCPPEKLTLLAHDHSEGEEMEYGGEMLPVEKTEESSFRSIDLALFATPAEVSRTMCPVAQAAGAWAVDASSAFRLDPKVPLVVPTFNADILRRPFDGKIVSCPSAITSALVAVVEPLRQAFGVKGVFLTAFMSASSSGKTGVRELEAQTADLLSGRQVSARKFPHRLGFNLIPAVGGTVAGSLSTREEQSWSDEAARLWTDPIQVVGTAVQVPTFYGHGLSLVVDLGRAIQSEELMPLWKGSEQIKRIDGLEEQIYPMPMLVTADSSVHVGRIRQVSGSPDKVLLFAVVDNAGRGAAISMVEAGEILLQKKMTVSESFPEG